MQERSVPLYVDLDGTLIFNDISTESIITFIKSKPWAAIFLPLWILKGKSYLKRKVAERVSIDPAILPMNKPLLSYLRQETTKRSLVLATASDEIFAKKIADHLGIFSHVIGSNGIRNIKGVRKIESIRDHIGNTPFAYAGNSAADLPIFRAAAEMIVVNASKRVIQKARSFGNPTIVGKKSNPLRMLLGAMRMHHWVKNMLVFVPLLTAHALMEPMLVARVCVALIAFSVTASAVYLLNDIVDIDADRKHAWKKNRPIAAGVLSIPVAIVAVLLLLAFGTVIATQLPVVFQTTLCAYFVTTVLYSFFLKRLLIVDTVTLASLYTLRIIGGTTAAGVPYSAWLLAFSMFLFFSLALMKRFSELRMLDSDIDAPLYGREYVASDRHLILQMGVSSSYLSILVLALYITSDQVRSLYTHPTYLWLTCPLLLTFVSRLWMIAYRNTMQRDPVAFVLNDVSSVAFVLLSTGVVFMAT